MNDPDIDLTRLGRRTPPEPRQEAQEAAKRSALDAFDMAARNNLKATKGTSVLARLHRIATQTWSYTMHAKYLSGSALATLIIVPIAGIAAYQVMQNNAGPTYIKLPSQLEAPAEKKDAAKENELQSQLGGKVAATDELTQTPLTEAAPAKPATLPEGRARQDLALVEKAKEREAGTEEAVAPAIADKKAESDATFAQDMAAAPAPESVAPAAGLARKMAPEGMLGAQLSSKTLEPNIIVEENRDNFPEFKSNGIVLTATQPVSTFSVDVDTSGYSSLRRTLNQGVLPDKASVRIEEMVNYFPYSYAGPANATDAFKANVTVTPTPWNKNTKLLHVGIKGFDLPAAEQRPANLVFLIDVSGSMDEADKLPLLKSSFRLLVNKLKPADTVSIVTYAGDAGVVLEPTKASDKAKILSAIDNLQPGGSTAGEAGINAAYALAQKAFVKDGVNRIMLATDGDFNVGAADDEALKKLVEDKRKTGVFLSILGFGAGNYQDNLMQTLAQNGNGIAAYIDTLGEAEKVLVQEATASLFTIAKDVKIQVEFNPATISEYRLIGYETRHLNNEDFNNDRVDAGDIGSGHTVTAIYEMTPKGAPGQTNDPLRYKTDTAKPVENASGEYAFVKIRYKLPNEATSRLVTHPVTPSNETASAPNDVNFAIAVAAFGQKLRDEDQVANFSMAEIEKLASASRGEDPFGYRGEFLKLVRLAAGLAPQ
jgi:Ca-activated chloride channel family protein